MRRRTIIIIRAEHRKLLAVLRSLSLLPTDHERCRASQHFDVIRPARCDVDESHGRWHQGKESGLPTALPIPGLGH
jgi:hypothetical protein